MKKLFFTLIFFGFSWSLSAQLTLKAGGGYIYHNYSISPIKWDHIGGSGYQAGLSALWGYPISAEVGVLWASSFSELSTINDNGNGPLRLDHRVSFLRIPVLAGYVFREEDGQVPFGARVFLGPVFNVIMQVHNSIEHEEAPDKADYKGMNWGLTGGVNVTYRLFFAEAGYEIGMSRMFQNTADFGESRANIFFLSIGARFRL